MGAAALRPGRRTRRSARRRPEEAVGSFGMSQLLGRVPGAAATAAAGLAGAERGGDLRSRPSPCKGRQSQQTLFGFGVFFVMVVLAVYF